MSDIENLERRIVAAMDRIAQGVSNVGASAGSDTDTADLSTALEEEKLANAQLTERLAKVSERAEASEARAQATAVAAAQRIEALDVELQRLRKATEQLRESNAALRDANAAGVGDAHLINKAMMAELEALRATRAADVAEADTILQALGALLDQEVTHA